MRRKPEKPSGTPQAESALLFGLTPEASSGDPALIEILAPADALDTLRAVQEPVAVTMLDPWYNKGVGGLRDDYHAWLGEVIEESFRVSEHVFVWGFPEIVGKVIEKLPVGTNLVAWLTWYYKNCPSVVRGWRSAQYACLHLSRTGAKLYPERFLNATQLQRKAEGKLRYMPGPPNVLEAPLNIGFVGKSEQTGHPAQKPVAVIEPLLRMTAPPGSLVVDPMCGSGTTGVACRLLGLRSVLCDASDEYLKLAEARLGVPRQKLHRPPKYSAKKSNA